MWIIHSKYGDADFYTTLEKELFSLIEGEKNLVANLANISAWLNFSIPDLNWCGFYLWDKESEELVLGPFQGRPACIRIKPGRGVCGSAYKNKITLRVDDVHEFPGHIACDSASRSELVVPLFKNGEVQGVLDLDSPKTGRFSKTDEDNITKILTKIAQQIF